MAPTQMKLRVRRRGSVAADAAAAARQPGEEEEEEEDGSRPSGARSSRRKSSSRASPSPPGSSSVMVAEDASPDSKCPICLDRFNNLAYLDRCLHRFCFPCIQEWSHNKAECPLCKQPFASILHSVRAEDDFKEYTLQPAPNSSSVAATVAMVAAMASAARSNQQMRLMLRRHRGVDAAERRRRRERRGRRRSGSRTGDEWFLDSSVTLPPLPPLPPHPSASPVLTDNSQEADGVDEQRMSDGAASPDGGVMFEGMMRLGGAVLPLTSSSRDSRRMLAQLAARRRMQQESGSAGRVRERETLAFRRDLYRCGIRVSGIQGQQQQRDLSAESFRRSPELLSRLGPWLRRELSVLYGAHGSLAHIIQRIIMARLARHGLEDTPTVEEELRPFLLARTDHFLHELLSFARSPLSLESYDLQAVYEPPPSAPLEAISSSSDRESVIAISEGEEEQGLLGGEQDRVGGASDVIQARSSLSQSAWEDETPGPSHSAAEPSCSLSSLSFSPAQQEAANEEDGEKEEEEECLIVGYKKPIAERTPELVQLSSDSEEEEEEEEEHKRPVSPRTTPPLLHLPVIPPSTSGTNPKEQEEELRGGGEECEQTCSGRSRKSSCGPQQQGEGEGRSSKERRRQRRRSGTLFNPNRCIYPGLMHQPSPSPSSSPFQSSGESSPPDSSWEYSCSLASRMSWSSSPPRSPPQTSEQSPPPPAAPPGECGEKPGGKRKYKSRHLDSNSEEPSWKQRRSSHGRGRRRERKRKERRRRPRPGVRRRDRALRPSEGGGRRSREERSPSVEIIYEGPVVSAATPTAHRRRRKQQLRTAAGSSPIIITLDSDESQDGLDGRPAVHPQTLDLSDLSDLSDLLPLPLLLPDGVCPTTPAEGGGAAGEILTNPGSPGLDQESPRQPQDNSDHDVDVETVEGQHFLLGSEEVQRSEVFSVLQSHGASASRLLASILRDVQVVSQPKWTLASSGDSPVGEQGTDVSRPLPELPPLLQQVSPVRWSSRDTPPPLSPRLSDCAPAACSTNHKPWCAPGSAPQSASTGGDVPSAHSQSTSTERRKQRSSTPPGGRGPSGVKRSQRILEDFAPSRDAGTDSHPSSVLLMSSSCRSSQIPSRAAAGAALDAGAPSLAPPKSTVWKCGSGAAPPTVQHTALSSSASSAESKLSAGASSDSQESQPAVGSH